MKAVTTCMDDDETTHDGGDERAAGDETTDSGAAGGGSESTTTAKKQRQLRRPNRVGSTRERFTEVNPKTGLPTEPKHLARGYGLQLGAILRETVSVNETKLRTNKKKHLQVQLIARLHQRYEFPPAYDNKNLKGNIVNERALSKFSTRGMIGNNERDDW